MKKEDIFEAQAKTLLGPVNEIFLSEKFTDADEKIGEKETIIGELFPYEKALFTRRGQITSEHNDLVIKGLAGDQSVIPEIKSMKKEHELISKLLWLMVHNRLDDTGNSGIWLRQGYKIVKKEETSFERASMGK